MASFENTLPMMLHRTLDAVMPQYRELFKRFDLTEQQWRVLRVLWSSDRVSSADLAERTLLLQPSLVGIIDRLERKDLVTRVRSVDDRRVVYIVATAKSRALQDKVIPETERIHEQLQAAVSKEEWAAMEATIAKITRAALSEAHKDVANG